MARRFQNQRRAPSRPNRAWAGIVSTGYTTVALSAKVLLGTFSLSNPNIDETILRTVGTIAVTSDQNAATEDIIGAFGMILVTDLAVTAGVASIPDPVTDTSDDGWFLYVPFAQSLAFSSGVGFDAQFATQYTFDSKAKRRMEEGQQAAIVVANASASFGFQVAMVFRLLSQITGT